MSKKSNSLLITNYFFQSKYNVKNLYFYPKILNLIFNTVIYYKQKNKIFLFIKILCLLFFNNFMNTRFYFKNNYINILRTELRNEIKIIQFLFHFIYINLPLLDSFSTEFKCILNRTLYTFCFFKFPLFFELSVLFSSLEYLLIFVNKYKFQLIMCLRNLKKASYNTNFLQQLKMPVLVNS